MVMLCLILCQAECVCVCVCLCLFLHACVQSSRTQNICFGAKSRFCP